MTGAGDVGRVVSDEGSSNGHPAAWHDDLVADADTLGEDHTSFIQFEGMPVLSRTAIQLHAAAIASSIEDGQPGFVDDDYLNALAAETTTTALELEGGGHVGEAGRRLPHRR